MTLRKKTLLVIGLTLVGLIVFLYFISQTILLGSYVKLEEQSVQQNVERAVSALQDQLAILDSTAGDWAPWDDTYTFVEDANEEYVTANLVDTTFINLKLNLMLFIDTSNQIVFGKAFDLEQGVEVELPTSIRDYLADYPFILHHPDPESSLTGIIMLPEAPFLFASRPILTSDYQGPIHGTLIVGRYLNSTEIENLAETTHLSIAVRRFDDPALPADFEVARMALSKDQPIFVRPINTEVVAGYTWLEDVAGQPALLLKVSMPRDIYQQGQMTLSYFVLFLLIIGLVFVLVTLLLLEKLILSRLAYLNQSVSRIGAKGDLSARVILPGEDELGELAQALNDTLARLEESQHELRKSEQENRAILDAIPDLILRIRQDGTLLNYKAAKEGNLIVPAGNFLGQSIDAILPSALAQQSIYHLQQALQTKAIQVFEHQLPAPKHAPQDYEVRIVANGDHEVLAMVRNITERRQAEEAMALAKMKTQLLANVSHDLRTPLNAILGYTEMLQEGVYGQLSDRQQNVTNEIIESTGQLLDVINNLLDQAQIEAGKITLQTLPFTPAKLVEQVLSTVGVLAHAKGLTLTSQIAPDIPATLYGDPARLRQILTNLVDNALKFTKQGQIHTHIYRVDSEHWALQVADTGPGIPPEAKTYIFDPFRQVDHSLTREQGGIGLGLSIVKELTTLMGGQIILESAVGKGTVFTVILPLLLPSEEAL